jgi:hypothetical protein
MVRFLISEGAPRYPKRCRRALRLEKTDVVPLERKRLRKKLLQISADSHQLWGASEANDCFLSQSLAVNTLACTERPVSVVLNDA